ncbi:hypothetical protein LXL04_010250 [Taraxacum kok-saghyz]
MPGNQPSAHKDQREKQTSFHEVVNNEKLLWATIQHKGISHPEVQHLYHKVQSGYEKIILNDYQQVDLQEVEYSLWKLHYKHIDEYRKRIKKVSTGTETPNNLNSHVEGFKSYLSNVAEFYKDLIAKFRKTCGLTEETLLKKIGGLVETEPAILKKCHYVWHRFLVCLGDLSRYVELCKKPEVQKWGVAAIYYLEASTVWPHSGNPQNQLALLATYIGDDFLALYHCVRSLAVKEPFPDARDNIMLLFEKNKSSQLQSLSTNAHIDFSKPLKRLSSQIKSHSSIDSTNINKLGHNGNVTLTKTHLWPLFVRMISFFLVKPNFEDLPHTFASTMKELEALLALNDIELNSSLEPYDQFDSSRKGPYRALQSVTILIFVIHNLIKTSSPEPTQLSACTSWAWTCMFTCLGHFIQRCLTISDRQNCCSLLPAVVVFLEWYVDVIDYAEIYGEDEKVCNAKSYFLGALVDLVSEFDEDANLANQVALWEDYELRGFEPVSRSNDILDFCNSENRRNFESGNSIRVNRVLHASIKVADKLKCGSIIYDRSTKKFSKKNEREIIEEESIGIEEEEVILFKPLTRYNSEPIQSETSETSEQEDLRRSASLIGTQNSAGPPSLSGWVLNRESLNLEKESRSPNKRDLAPISEIPTSSYVAPVPSAPLIPEGFSSGVPGFVEGFRPPVFGLSSSEWLYRYTNNLTLEVGNGNPPNSNRYWPVPGSNPAGNVGNFHGYGGGSRYDVVDRWGNPLLTNRMVYLENPRERLLFGGYGGGGGGGGGEQPPVLQHVKEREWQLPSESPYRGNPYMGN